MSDLEILQGSCGIVLDVGDILDVDIKHKIKVVFYEGQIHRMGPDDSTSTILSNSVNLIGKISEVEVSQWINLVTHNLNSAVIGIDVHIRVLLLDDDGKLISVALVPDGVRSKRQGVGEVIVRQEWRVELVLIGSNVDLWLIVAFFVDKLW
jgi:hypothetical protein